MKLDIKEPYKTAIIISLCTSVVLGVAYVATPKKYRDIIREKAFRIFKKKEKKD